jgi:hypothetical protein
VEPPPPSPRADEATVELVPVVGVEVPATRSSVDAPVFAAEAPAGATRHPQPLRKRKRSFSNLR